MSSDITYWLLAHVAKFRALNIAKAVFLDIVQALLPGAT